MLSGAQIVCGLVHTWTHHDTVSPVPLGRHECTAQAGTDDLLTFILNEKCNEDSSIVTIWTNDMNYMLSLFLSAYGATSKSFFSFQRAAANPKSAAQSFTSQGQCWLQQLVCPCLKPYWQQVALSHPLTKQTAVRELVLCIWSLCLCDFLPRVE